MANVDSDKSHWDEDDRFYSSGSHSDESPILHYREKRRYPYYTSPHPTDDHERRSALSLLGKFCLFCAAMIVFCVLMYIPVYNKANYHIHRKGFVSGWPKHTNRDTKIYVQPNNVTTIYEPKDLCREKDKKIVLLIIVCSATSNFERRQAIRDTWGSYENYKIHLQIYKEVTEKYKDYNFKYDLYPERLNGLDSNDTNGSIAVSSKVRDKREVASFNQLIPVLAKALGNMTLSKTERVPEKKFVNEEENSEVRFEEDVNPVIPGFDMNQELKNEQTEAEDFDYNYDSNIMKIPPKTGDYDDATGENPDLSKVINFLRKSKDFVRLKNSLDNAESIKNSEFRVVFLLGMPSNDNSSVQKRIEEEIDAYDDIIQEGFVDSYNNLTLKSIMMLKWVTKHCNDSVRYIFKTDDDTYVNVPKLLLLLREQSREFDRASSGSREYLLLGDVISGARPVHDLHSKWYSPRYMYSGRVYPRYLSGMGYAMSVPAAHALYQAALNTHYFHLEDVYITGMCALRASPRVPVRDSSAFSYLPVCADACLAHAQATAHRAAPHDMRAFSARLKQVDEADRCERIRLTKVRQEMRRRELKLQKLKLRKTNT